jgi:hypothetical protein
MNKEITWYYEHEKIKYGDEKCDKYFHDNKMMMKDKKY